jgi:hypothetical protein
VQENKKQEYAFSRVKCIIKFLFSVLTITSRLVNIDHTVVVAGFVESVFPEIFKMLQAAVGTAVDCSCRISKQ